MQRFQQKVEKAFREEFGDEPRGAAAVVFAATLDSGNPLNFADWMQEEIEKDEWRVEPTQWHEGFTVTVAATEE